MPNYDNPRLVMFEFEWDTVAMFTSYISDVLETHSNWSKQFFNFVGSHESTLCGNNFDKPARLIRNDKMPSYILITEERGEVVRSCS